MPSWVQRRAASRTAFLHRDRGMGKTTVLLSLLYASSVHDDRDYPEGLRELGLNLLASAAFLELLEIRSLFIRYWNGVVENGKQVALENSVEKNTGAVGLWLDRLER